MKHLPTVGYLTFHAGRAYHVATQWEPEPSYTTYQTLCGISEGAWLGRGGSPIFSEEPPAGQRACRACQYRLEAMDTL